MYSASSAFNTAIKATSRGLVAKVVIGANTYLGDKILSLTYENTSNPDPDFELGSTGSAKVELSLQNVTENFEVATYQVYLGVDTSGTGTYEYVPMGTFYADTVQRTRNNVVNLTLYDAMIKLEAVYVSTLTYPQTITQVMTEIASKAGISWTGTLPAYSLSSAPSGYTYREMIGFIAQMNAGFATFNRSGVLEFRGYTTSTEVIDVTNYFDYQKKKDTVYTLNVITVQTKDDGTTITQGTLSAGGSELIFKNPFFTTSILSDVYTKINGFSYMPMLINHQGNPCTDLGDKLTFNTVDTGSYTIPVQKIDLKFDGSLSGSIESEGQAQNKNQFDSSGSLNNQLNRTNMQVQNLSVGTATIADASITTAKIADAAITSAKIQDATITGADIASATITNANIANATITGANIANATITNANLGSAIVQTGNIANLAVTNSLLATGISADKITVGTLDGSLITVKNLVADNIVTGTLTLASANLVQNSDFMTGDFTDWGSEDSTWTVDTTTLYQTSYTAKQVVSGLGADAWKPVMTTSFNCAPGDQFVASVYTMTNNLASIDRGAYLEVDWFNSSGTQLSNSQAYCAPASNNVWVRTILNLTAPANAATFKLRCHLVRNGTLWATRFQIVKGTLNSNWQPSTNDLLVAKGINGVQIADGTVTNTNIAAATITGDRLVANTITATQIAANTITSTQIAANTITAGNMNVATLSAISANLGTVTAGSLSGVTITSTSISDPNIYTQIQNENVQSFGTYNVYDTTNNYAYRFSSNGIGGEYFTHFDTYDASRNQMAGFKGEFYAGGISFDKVTALPTIYPADMDNVSGIYFATFRTKAGSGLAIELNSDQMIYFKTGNNRNMSYQVGSGGAYHSFDACVAIGGYPAASHTFGATNKILRCMQQKVTLNPAGASSVTVTYNFVAATNHTYSVIPYWIEDNGVLGANSCCFPAFTNITTSGFTVMMKPNTGNFGTGSFYLHVMVYYD